MNDKDKKLTEAYDSPPFWYDIRGFFILTFTYRNSLTTQVRFFSKNFRKKHLEVAVGSGSLLMIMLWYLKLLRTSISEIYAFDYSPAMLKGAVDKFEKNKSIHLSLGDVGGTNFPSAFFDSINMANAVHCFDKVDEAFTEMHRVITDNGTIAINFLLYPEGRFSNLAKKINAWGMKKGILYTPYQEHECISILEKNHFEIVESKKIGNCLYVIAKKSA